MPRSPTACSRTKSRSRKSCAPPATARPSSASGISEDEAHWPESQGFEVNIGGWSFGRPRSYFSPYRNPKLTDGPEDEHLTSRLAEESVGLIRQFHAEDKPFLLVHSFYTVHGPLQAPEDTTAKYTSKAEQHGLKNRFGRETQYHYGKDAERRVRETQAHPVYAAMVEHMDRAVGRILDTLHELELDENTLVIFVSDNGGLSSAEGSPTSNQPLRGGKGWIYEGGIRIPFIVKDPTRNAAGLTNAAPASTIDLMPTILAFTGTAPPSNLKIDGKNILPLLSQPKDDDLARELFWHYPHYSNQGGFPGGALRAGDWKLVENFEDGSIALYNLAEDLGELRDLAATEAERVDQMRRRLHDWYTETGALFLRPGKAETTPWSPDTYRP